MLPPGHFAAGFLIGTAVASIFSNQLSPTEIKTLSLLGGFFGFAPDLDMFIAFWKERGFTMHNEKTSHRDYLPHAPFVWVLSSIIIFAFATNIFWVAFALTLWLSSWSHFFLDSFKFGIRWLWPFSNKYYTFAHAGQKKYVAARGFFRYWFGFLKIYTTDPTFRPTFIMELVILSSVALLMVNRLVG